MMNIPETLTIGAFAKAAGVNVETIRFYQRKGLLPEPDKPYGSIRRYGETDVTRVRFVKSAQRLGFSLDEIAELLRLEDGTHCEEASSLAEHKLKDVREYVLVGAFVVGAIFTPPDVISQLMLAVPVYLLYELGILASRWFTPGIAAVEAQQREQNDG